MTPDNSDFCGEFFHALIDVTYGMKTCDNCDIELEDHRNVFACRDCKRKYYEYVRPWERAGAMDTHTFLIIDKFI